MVTPRGPRPRAHQNLPTSSVMSLSPVIWADSASTAVPRHVDLVRVCEHYFGPARTTGSSHADFKTSWAGDPRVTIQNDHGKAQAYQVRQVLAAIAKKESEDGDET